jgi:inosose dehydratase
MPTISRRRFVTSTTATLLTAPLAGRWASAAPQKIHVACNQFCWINMYRRQKKDFNADLDAGLAEVKRSGMDGLEAMLGNPASAERIVPLLKNHGLAMRSLDTGATLYDPAATAGSIRQVVSTAKKAKELIDLQIVVVNPTPLRGQSKSDEQLKTQAAAMTRLGGQLAESGITLAYHFHAPAWQNEGREFHHVMTQTDPALVQLCLDTHWVFRGSGNNEQRVHEVVKRYGTRVAELHMRQSQNGVWTECLTDGDIDYPKVAAELKAQGVKPLLVLEQAVEAGTPNTMDAVESHRRSRAYVEKVFGTLFS